MNVLVATDGSKYGQWGLNWAASLPFVEPPKVMALHVLDSAWLRGPFRTRPEILRVEARSARTLKKAKQQLAALKLKGTVRKEQGAVAPVILKRAPKRDGLLVVGSQGLAPSPWLKSQELKEANLKLIDQSVRKLIKAGFTAEPLYQLGNPAEEIMTVAAKQHADLIVMGAQGLGAMGRFLLGSVSTRVVQHATCAVRVVRSSQRKKHRGALDRFPGVSSGVMA